MKLFSGKPTWNSLARAGVRLSGIDADYVQMKPIACLNNSLSQLEKMKSFKPDATNMTKGIDVLIACKAQINSVLQGLVASKPRHEQSELLESEGLSPGRRP